MIRAFVALPVPEGLVPPLTVLAQMLPLARRLPPENWHVTLAFLGQQPEPALEGLHHELLAIRAAPVPLSLTAPGIFGGDHPRLTYAGIAPVPELLALHHAVLAACRRAGIAPEARRFIPHVTLSRERPEGPARMRLEHALADLSGFRAGPETAPAFHLLQSHLGHGPARYEVLAEYNLAP